MNIVLQSLYLLLPAYFANASCTLFNRWTFLATPLDFNKKIGNHYILGPGKTYRGTLMGLAIAMLTVLIQKFLYSFEFFQNISLINYQQINWFSLGILAGLGAVGGDLAASFLKRRLHLPRGTFFPLLDQWDFIIGFFLLTSLLIDVPQSVIVVSFIMTLIIHPLTNMIAYLLKIKTVWW